VKFICYMLRVAVIYFDVFVCMYWYCTAWLVTLMLYYVLVYVVKPLTYMQQVASQVSTHACPSTWVTYPCKVLCVSQFQTTSFADWYVVYMYIYIYICIYITYAYTYTHIHI